MKTSVRLWLLILLAVPLLISVSCSKIKELAAVDVAMTLPRQHFTYSGTLLKSGETILYTDSIRINLDSILNVYGFSSGIIQNTYFTYLAVTIEQPKDSTFHWLSSMRATVADNRSFDPENEVGTVTNEDPNAKSVVVKLNNVNIRPYLTKPSFFLRVYGVLNGPLPATIVGMYLEGSIQFRVAPI